MNNDGHLILISRMIIFINYDRTLIVSQAQINPRQDTHSERE